MAIRCVWVGLLALPLVGVASSAKLKLTVRQKVLGKVPHADYPACSISPDARHCAWDERADGKQWLVVDGVTHKKFDGVLEWMGMPYGDNPGEFCGLVWSGNSKRLSYVAKVGKQRVAVVDGTESLPFDDVRAGTFSADGKSFAFVGQRGKEHILVQDGKEGEHYDALGQPIFAPVGHRLAYGAARGKELTIIVDGVTVVTFDGLSGRWFRFGPDGRHYAFSYEKHGQWRMLMDGVEGPECADIAEPLFSPSGRTLCFTVPASKDKMALSVNGVPQQRFTYIHPDGVKFSPDGRHLSYVGENGHDYEPGGAEDFVVIDGKLRQVPDVCNIHGFLWDGEPVIEQSVEHGAYLEVRGRRGKEFQLIDHVTISSDGRHFAYVGRTDSGEAVVFDGVQGPEYDQIRGLMFSPRGGRYAYVARKDDKYRLVVDGKDGQPHQIVTNPAFTPDGKHVIYETIEGDRSTLWVDATKGPSYVCATWYFDLDRQSKVVLDGDKRFHFIGITKADDAVVFEVTIHD